MADALTEITRIDSIIQQKEEIYQSDRIRIPVLKSYLHTVFGKNDEASQTIQLVLQQFPNLENEISIDAATIFYSLANVHAARNNFNLSIHYLEKAKNIRVQLFGEYHLSLSRIYISLGNSYNRTNDFDRALVNYNKALEILSKNNRSESDDAAYSHLYIMSTLIDMGEYYKAIEHGKKSIEIYSLLSLQEHIEIAGLFGKFCEVYTILGDLEKAEEYSLKALNLLRSKYPFTLSSQAQHIQRLADIYRRMGKLDKALEFTTKGISLTEKSYGKNHPQAGFMYELAAGVYSDRKEYIKAVEYYQKALTNRLAVGARGSFGDVIAIYLSLANVYMQMNRYDTALVCLHRAEEFESRSIVKNTPQKGLLFQRFGEYYQSQGKYSDALSSYRKGVAILGTAYSSNAAPDAGDIKKSNYKKETYDVVVRIADLYRTMFAKGKKRADLEQALAYYRIAMDLVDDIRRGYATDGSKFILAEQSTTIYAKACRTALDLFALTGNSTYQEQAFLAADRSKANALMEQLFDREAKHFAGIPDSLLQQENALLSAIASHEIRMQKPQENNENAERMRQKVQSELFDLKVQHQKFVEYLEHQYPQYHALKYADYSLTLKTVQHRLAEDEVLIEYLTDGSAIHSFAVTNSGIVSTTTSRAASISHSIDQFTAALKKYETGTYHSAGKYLYAQLLKPFERVFKGKRRVTIVPDGKMHYVPFEALPVKKYKPETMDFTSVPYLIRYCDVNYSYSAAFSTQIQGERDKSSMSFAGFAPVFRDSTKNGDFLANRSFVEESGLSDVRSITLDGKTFNELKYSEEELLSIGYSFQSRSLPYKNFLHTSATETNFKLFSSRYDVVHVATHGFMNEKNPKLSAVLFSQPQEPTATDDGILYLNETYALDLKADLVVLSSCESGLGTLVQGEGMMALTRGLFYAGAKNIVFSLWKVSDKQTYLLMDEFYKQMLTGKSYSSSLRQAKLKMIASQESAFPSKWSGFVLIGE
ncbi:MAG: CHAT domain-containing tetratricopeptide repeat protein [Bacteroidota bacterium]